MISMKRMKKCITIMVAVLAINVFLGTLSVVYADAIIMKNGRIYLGKIISATAKGIVIESLGKSYTISQTDIVKSGQDVRLLSGINVSVEMMDNSFIKGEVDNYDDEVGLLLKTDFGLLTLPADKIKSVTDTGQKGAFSGNYFHLGITSGVYFPIGSFGKSFSLQPFVSVLGEVNSRFARGLYFGAELGYLFMKYRQPAVKFNSFYLDAYVQYRFLQLRGLKTGPRILVPFFGAGAGVLYVARRDDRSLSRIFWRTRKQDMNALYVASLGLDIYAHNNVIVRISGGWRGVQQKSSLLNSFNAGAGIIWAY